MKAKLTYAVKNRSRAWGENVDKLIRASLKVLGYILIGLVIFLFAARLAAEWERVASYEIELNYSWGLALLLFAFSVVVSGLFWGQIVSQISPSNNVKRIESLRGHLGAWIFRYIPGVGTAVGALVGAGLGFGASYLK